MVAATILHRSEKLDRTLTLFLRARSSSSYMRGRLSVDVVVFPLPTSDEKNPYGCLGGDRRRALVFEDKWWRIYAHYV